MNTRIEDLETLLHHLDAAETIISRLPRWKNDLIAVAKIGHKARRLLSTAQREAYEADAERWGWDQ